MDKKMGNLPLAKMLSTMYRIYSQYMADVIKTYGINLTDLSIIMGLNTLPGYSLNAFAKSKRINKAILSKALKKLQADGLVLQKADDCHKQRYKLFLTPKGQELVPKLKKQLDVYENAVLADMSEEERNSLKSLLERVFELEVLVYDG